MAVPTSDRRERFCFGREGFSRGDFRRHRGNLLPICRPVWDVNASNHSANNAPTVPSDMPHNSACLDPQGLPVRVCSTCMAATHSLPLP